MKVALIHDWLTGMRGGEKVLEALCELFPDADIFTLVWIKGSVSAKIEKHRITTSFLQKLPLVEKRYRHYLPLMSCAIRSLDVSGYDLVISSSHCVAKGVSVRKGAVHICYCHTPMRYIWNQYDEYFNRERAGFLVSSAMKLVRPYLQKWDVKTADGVDLFIANSNHVRKRINEYYRKDAQVVHPPVDIEGYPAVKQGNYFLMVTALVPYKRVDMAIKAFNKLGLPLKIVGSGPDAARLKNLAAPNIEFLGWQEDSAIKQYYAGCRAFIFPQEEDFGITAVEAQAAGKPVIAFGKGGAQETVIEGATGTFFYESTAESLADAVQRFERMSFSEEKIKMNAQKFALQRFEEGIKALVSLQISNKISKINFQ